MNATERERDNFGALYDDATTLWPGRTALVEGESGERVTYGELADRVARAGHALADLGVERGDRVALCFPNELTYLYLLFGAMRLGAVPVPVNVQASRETLRYVVADSGAEVVVSSETTEILSDAVDVAEAVDGVESLAVAAEESDVSVDGASVVPLLDGFADRATSLPPASVSPADAAMQPYTSGSTGKPKGVVVSHGGATWNTRTASKVHLYDRDERGLVAAPLYHKNAMAGAVKPAFATGGSVVVLDGFDPESFVAAVDEYEVTYFTGVPAMFTLLTDAADALAAHDVSSVTWAICGSDTVPESLHEAFAETFDAKLLEAYGLTEGGPVVTLSPRWGPTKQGSAGLALPGVETLVVDPDTDEVLPPGETGELLASSPGVARYHDRPDAEAASFEERDGRRFLRTGDLARVDDDGYHYIVGRLDEMLVVGGENVYPAEVETLLERHDAVADVAVVAAPHEVKGEAPVAFVVRQPVADATEDDLKQFALDRGPAYAHPRRVFFVEALPLTGTGKVDRDALSTRARERLDEPL